MCSRPALNNHTLYFTLPSCDRTHPDSTTCGSHKTRDGARYDDVVEDTNEPPLPNFNPEDKHTVLLVEISRG